MVTSLSRSTADVGNHHVIRINNVQASGSGAVQVNANAINDDVKGSNHVNFNGACSKWRCSDRKLIGRGRGEVSTSASTPKDFIWVVGECWESKVEQ